MGTSKKRSNRKVKELLKQLGNQDIKKTIPIATSLVLSDQNIAKEVNQQAFKVIMQVGIDGINELMNSGRYKHFAKEELKNDEKLLNEFLEELLEIVEDLIEESISSLLQQAFKLAMSLILKEDKDIGDFLIEFTFYFLYLIVQGELIEEFGDNYFDASHEEINNLIKLHVRKIVTKDLASVISDYLNGTISLKKLINFIIEVSETLEYGEF